MLQEQPRASSTPTPISDSSSSFEQCEPELSTLPDSHDMSAHKHVEYDIYFDERSTIGSDPSYQGMTAFERIFEDQRRNIAISHSNYSPIEFVLS
ncbi:hypothetical protein OSTOST_14366 [Ostertagia ostertagi]